MTKKKALVLLGATLGLATLIACGDHDRRGRGRCGTKGGSGAACGEVEILGFDQEIPNQRLLCVGETVEIEARPGSAGTGASSPIQWTMSRPSYVTIEVIGLKARVTGVSVGTSYVKATQTCDGDFAVANFEVRNCKTGGGPSDAATGDASATGDATSVVDSSREEVSPSDGSPVTLDDASPVDTSTSSLPGFDAAKPDMGGPGDAIVIFDGGTNL